MKASELQDLKKWASEVPEDKAKELLVTLVISGIESADIAFNSESVVPYCRHTGDPLIEGQKIYPNG